ncbi:hypothetical protein [Pedobacter sp. Hv1]|uniref:hypothetical protein n=1 Tax=Pedobacter sp. Hv1 TaxID=1740090 RepID=UPI0006D88D83|nr:hypothetical protein [Pedobacter sp. Hv1]KQC02431.1 hypothetical protein AQF98_02295 [Pedobacter sp. Hv1]
MVISKNINNSRYEWASSVINNLLEESPVIYDFGAKDSIILSSITKNINYKAYDLAPEIASINKWDINFEEKN